MICKLANYFHPPVLGQSDGTFAPRKKASAQFVHQGEGWTSFDTLPRQVADVNGDGRADIIGFAYDSVQVALSEFNIIYGNSGNEEIISRSSGDMLIEAAGGDDTLGFTDVGYKGNDTLDGGSGKDTVTFANSEQGYTVNLNGANLSVATNSEDGSRNKSLKNIENVIGSNFADELKGDGNANRLEGGGGDDVLEGNNGNDTLSGGEGDDVLDGGSDSDWFIEQGDVSLFELKYDQPTDKHKLSGLGNDTLINIEKVELSGGASNNTLDASLATANVNLEGLGGDDNLKGGFGDDTLVGGKGTNELWGGEGRDTFEIDTSSTSINGDIQIIHDFERTVDSIDVVGADLRYISFNRGTNNEGIDYTIIRENVNGNIVERAKVLGTTQIDGTDLSAFRTIYQPISPEKVGDLDYVIEEWAKNYAEYIGTTLDSDVSLAGVSLTQGQVSYEKFKILPLPDGDNQVLTTHINKTNLDQPGVKIQYRQRESATSTVTQATSYSDTTTSAQEHGWKIGAAYEHSLKATTSGKFLGIGLSGETTSTFKLSGEGFGNYSSSGSHTNGGSKTYSDVEVVENSIWTTYDYTAPAQSVTEFRAISDKTTHTGDYEMDVAIGGDVKFRLADNTEVTVPVALILEQYNPEIFHAQDANYKTYSLRTGEQIIYSSNLEFTVKGTIESQEVYNTRVVTEATYDILLNGGQTYDAETKKERFWVASGQIPLDSQPTPHINSFAVGSDKIGFANVPDIIGFDSLDVSNNGKKTKAIIRYAATGQVLAALVGVDATSLDVDDFIFDTTGTAIE